jgi:hypothetical protein
MFQTTNQVMSACQLQCIPHNIIMSDHLPNEGWTFKLQKFTLKLLPVSLLEVSAERCG